MASIADDLSDNDEEEKTVDSFSADLLGNALKHKDFLLCLHSIGVSLKKPTTESVRRYEELWLPLLVQNLPDPSSTQGNEVPEPTFLIPPPDIAWLWHCHRLAPLQYITYIRQRFGSSDKVSHKAYYLEATPPFSFQQPPSEEMQAAPSSVNVHPKTIALWSRTYPSEPFFLPIDYEELPTRRKKKSLYAEFHTFDLLGSTERQRDFLWQISAPRFSDPAFLIQGLENYKRFLKLRRSHPNQTIVPTYQIDLLWHTHMLSGLAQYNQDCIRITGSQLHHDDSFNDRTEGGALDVAFQATCEIWEKEYDEAYHIEGGMYRGEPPSEFYDTRWASQQDIPPIKTVLQMLEVQTNAPEAKQALGWTSLYGMAPNILPGFIHRNAKSTRRGVNSNPRMDEYVFGNHSTRGTGYYHFTTREACAILLRRIDKQISRKNNDLTMDICLRTTFTCGLADASSGAAFQKTKKELNELTDLRDLVNGIRKLSKPPATTLDVDLTKMKIAKLVAAENGRKQKATTDSLGTGAGGVAAVGSVYSYNHIMTAAACGAGDPLGGGCGGNAVFMGGGGCGAAAACGGGHNGGGHYGGHFGGGGCGGAGCGGGGCGGGGCGGGG